MLWRGEVNVMDGTAVYEVMNDDGGGGGGDHSAHGHTDRHTKVKTVYPPVSLR